MPWQAISCPRPAISRSSAPCRSAIQPSVKNVARRPVASNRSRSRWVADAIRDGRASQRSRPITCSKFETWKYSSRSTLSAFVVTLDPAQEDHRLQGLPEDEQVHREGSVLQVVHVERELVLHARHVVGVAVSDLRPAGDAGAQR